MNHKLKALGLAFVAALAMSAVAASAATAQDDYFAPSAPTVGTGTQEGTNVFTTEGGTVTCNTALFRGTQGTETAPDLTVTPVYEGCTAFGILGTDILMSGCTYTFTTPTGGPTTFTAESPHVLCPEGATIRVTPTVLGSSVCTATIPAQTPTSGSVEATNITDGGVASATVTSKVAGIHYTVDGGGGLCGPTGGTTSDGKYDGSVILRGYNDAASGSDINHTNVREPVSILNT